jgi:cytochrome c oxidase subunit 2
MNKPEQPKNRRVLIASSHPLFGQGLRNLLQERQQDGVVIVGMVSSLQEAIDALQRQAPDLIVVDYDDEKLNREAFLARFVEGEQKLRVVLLSLNSPREALVYDRRTMAAAEVDDWLEEWTYLDDTTKSLIDDRGEISNGRNRRSSMKHIIIAGILVVLMTVLLLIGLENINLLPVQASVQAESIDALFGLELKMIAFLFSLIVVMMLYSIIVFRRKKGDESDAAHIEGNTKLEIAWTVAPLATVMFLAVLGGQSLAETLRPDPKPIKINVIGQQWAWRFEYPELGIVSDTLYMPVNKQADLNLWSEDVIHSFWVPEFRVKQDALPGGEANKRRLPVTPKLTGNFTLRCAELCGLQHTTMESKVVVVSAAEFEAWVKENSLVADDPVARGATFASQYGCQACHSLDGSKIVGPSWKGIFGTEVKSVDGQTAIVDDAYLLASIVNPNEFVHEGFPPNLMPATYSEQLTPEQIADIIEFIKSLK